MAASDFSYDEPSVCRSTEHRIYRCNRIWNGNHSPVHDFPDYQLPAGA